MLACGSTVGHAFVNLYYIHEAAKIQVLAMQAAAVAGSGGLKDIAGVDGPAFDRMREPPRYRCHLGCILLEDASDIVV